MKAKVVMCCGKKKKVSLLGSQLDGWICCWGAAGSQTVGLKVCRGGLVGGGAAAADPH